LLHDVPHSIKRSSTTENFTFIFISVLVLN
jgi:hypothetical protein